MISPAVDPIDKTFRYLGLLLTVASAALTYAWASTFKIHWLVDLVLPFGLVGAAVASAYAWPKVVDRIRQSGSASAAPVIAFAALFTATDIVSNFGSIAWQRTVDMDNATMQNTKYDDTRNSVAESERQLKVFSAQLAALQTAHGWAASANANALRQQIADKQAMSDREAARGGCGPKCEAHKAEVIAMTQRLGTLEQRDDLTQRIDATKRVLAGLRAKSTTVEKAQSGAALSTVSFASMFTLSRNPNEAAMHWTDKGLSWLVAAFFTFGAMGCNMLGWGNLGGTSGRKDNEAPTVARETPSAPASVPTVTPLQPAVQREIVMVDRKDDWSDALKQYLASLENRLHTRSA